MNLDRTEPRKILLRRQEVLDWTGLSKYELRQLESLGVVRSAVLVEGGRRHFHKEQIRQAVFGPFSTK